MPLFGDTGTPYDPQYAAGIGQALQSDPWKLEADQRKAAIQARGGQWNQDDYSFFGLQPSTSQEWKDKYLGSINELAAQRISQQAGAGNFNTGRYTVDPTTGQVTQRQSFVDTPLGKIATLGPMIAGGGLAAASALGGGGAAVPETLGGQGSVAGGAVGPEGVVEGVGGAGGVSVGDEAAGIGAGIAGKSPSLLGPLLNTGMRLGSALIGAHAANTASQQLQQQARNALALDQSLYNRSSAALMPYYQMGAGSLGRLQSFLGTPSAPALPPAGTLGTLGK